MSALHSAEFWLHESIAGWRQKIKGVRFSKHPIKALSETGGCHRQLASPQLGARSPEVDLTTEASQGTG